MRTSLRRRRRASARTSFSSWWSAPRSAGPPGCTKRDWRPWPKQPSTGGRTMRLEILNRGYRPGTKLLFAVIRLFSGHPVPDAAKLVFYRPDFYGDQAKEFTHEAMRGPSAWSVGDRELMAAYVSKLNECAFCIGAHTATATQAYQDGPRVAAVLADLESASVEEPLRATLRMLGKLTAEGKVSAADMR